MPEAHFRTTSPCRLVQSYAEGSSKQNKEGKKMVSEDRLDPVYGLSMVLVMLNCLRLLG